MSNSKQVTVAQGFSGFRREAKRLSKEFKWNLISFDAFVRERGWNSTPGRWKAIIKDIEGEYTKDNILVGTEDDICNAASEIRRKCKSCGVVKPLTKFSKDRAPNKPGSTCAKRVCKKCIMEANAKKDKSEVARKAKEIRRSYDGLKADIYHHLQCTTRDRKWDDIISKPDFLKWLDSEGYDEFYNIYKLSGFNTRSRPVVDRIENDLPYIESNIQLMTWRESNAKQAARKYVHRLTTGLKSVKRIDRATKKVKIYKTMGLAAKDNDVSTSTISRLANGTTPNVGLGREFEWYWCNEDGSEYEEKDPTVCKLTPDGKTVLKMYRDASSAASWEGIKYKGIHMCLTGKRPIYMGFKWTYKRNCKLLTPFLTE